MVLLALASGVLWPICFVGNDGTMMNIGFEPESTPIALRLSTSITDGLIGALNRPAKTVADMVIGGELCGTAPF